jgi:hypothetical protein
LSKAIEGKESIPVKDIKKAVAKAIEDLLSKLEPNDSLTPGFV